MLSPWASSAAAARDPWPTRLLVMLLAVHGIAWTFVFYATQPCAPIDLVETLYWGREWQWGYYKNPPLPSWVAEAVAASTGVGLSIYAVSQLTAVVCLWAAWRVARDLLDPWRALLAAAALEACYYYTYAMSEGINNSIFVRMWWALAVLAFWRAVQRGQRRYWIAAGACLGLGMLSKYSIAVLALTLLLTPLLVPATRRHWRTAGPYLLLATALTIVAPHFVWLWQNDFITFGWFEERSVGWMTSRLRHLVYPLEFAVAHAGAFVPLLIVLAPMLALSRWRKFSPDEQPAARLLALLVGGPIVVYLLIPLVTGVHLRSMWGGPLFTFVPLALLYFCPQRAALNLSAARRALARCAIAGGLFLVVAAGRNIGAPRWNGAGSRIHFPGQQLADVVESHWRERCDRPLPAIGGPWWLAASVACYADDRPSVFGDFNARKHPWLSDDELEVEGAVFVWLADEHSPYFREIVRSRFPDAEYLPDATLAWQTSADLPPVRVCCAILPPASVRARQAPISTLATAPAAHH